MPLLWPLSCLRNFLEPRERVGTSVNGERSGSIRTHPLPSNTPAFKNSSVIQACQALSQKSSFSRDLALINFRCGSSAYLPVYIVLRKAKERTNHQEMPKSSSSAHKERPLDYSGVLREKMSPYTPPVTHPHAMHRNSRSEQCLRLKVGTAVASLTLCCHF